jgi:hypothetical protein
LWEGTLGVLTVSAAVLTVAADGDVVDVDKRGLGDELNLSFGLVHQDIGPRNLFTNPNTGPILLFDFDLPAGNWPETG